MNVLQSEIRFFESILIIGDNNEELHNDCFLIFVVNYFFIAGICEDFAMGFPGGCTSLGSSCFKRNIHILEVYLMRGENLLSLYFEKDQRNRR